MGSRIVTIDIVIVFQNKYKESFTKTKGKGYTVVSSTPEIEHAKKQSIRVSQNKYRADFEKNKGKFTSVSNVKLLQKD